MRKTVLDRLKRHEGFEQFPYEDTLGVLTIGYGFNLDSVGLSEEEASAILSMRLDALESELIKNKWYNELNDIRKDAIINMAYNLGLNGLYKFKKMIKALERHDYLQASIEAMDSRWSTQVKGRALELAKMIEEGI